MAVWVITAPRWPRPARLVVVLVVRCAWRTLLGGTAGVGCAMRTISRGLQRDLHAVPGDLDAARLQRGALGRLRVEDRVGVVDVDEHLALTRQALEHLEHAAGAALRQVAHLAAQLGA